ncbi:Serine/threonine-protein kinase TOR [Capsicum baccatum]|uniref:Serine/threonine-protein kinase TOR n=1 Tax=Capsicum baccatum TaxID=33114 RepID=A0A2G2XFK4_CAPBA|nr:Serine/threonine-protein kinase TOR [Capsicum baccatum]
MGRSSQAICYPVATIGARNIDALNRVLADLCTRSNPKDRALLTLRRLVEEETRYLSGEAFARFMDHLYELITTFLDSNEVSKNLGALRAIDELIDVTISENASKVAKFSNYISAAFETKRDPEILVLASKVLGHLDRSGGAMIVDEVECQVKVPLEWLHGERIEYRRFAAVLILKKMAENASTVFNVHVPEFVDAIWVALRDPTLVVGEKAIEALRACLRVIEMSETRWSVQWYYRMFKSTQDGLGRNAPVHSIHGSLLAIGELLRFLGGGWLHEEGGGQERASGFIALGEIAAALDGELTNYLPTITSHLRDAIAPRRGRSSLEALTCVGNIAKAMGPTMEPHVRGLLDSMFSSGLSLTLVEALEQITESIPPLLPTIQNRLLKCISVILSRSHHSMPRQLASGHDLFVFGRESVVVYLEDEDGATRKDVALCCCKIVANSFSEISSTHFSLSRINCASGKQRRRFVEEV